MSRELVEQFNTLIVKDYFVKEFVYIVDSWSGHKDFDMYSKIFNEKCKLFIIPSHSTFMVQLLDVFLF